MIINKKTLKANRYSEDRFVIKPNLFMVIDGATPLNEVKEKGKKTSASRFVSELKQYLLKHIGKTIDLLNSFSKLKYEENKNLELMPSCAISFVEINGNIVDCYFIGDCEIFIKFKNSTATRLVQKDLFKFDQHALEEYKKIRPNVSKHSEALSKINHILVSNRKLMNTPSGYNVYSPSNKELNFSHESYQLDEISEIYIYSDGISQSFDELHIYNSPEELFNKNNNIDLIIKEIKRVAFSDPECLKYPRFKKIDDTTIIQVKF